MTWWIAKSFRTNRKFWSWPNGIRDLTFVVVSARVWRKKVNETLSHPWMWWPEVLHCARIYRRKERVRRCRSSVMKGTVIWLHLLCALYINGAGRQAGQEGGSGQAVHVPPPYTLYIQQRRQQQQQQRGRLSWTPPRRQEGSSSPRRDFRIISGNSTDDRYMISRPVGRYSFILHFFFSKNGALAQNYRSWGHSVRWHQDLEDMSSQESRLLRIIYFSFLNSLYARAMKIPLGTRWDWVKNFSYIFIKISSFSSVWKFMVYNGLHCCHLLKHLLKWL